jgi:uncharacterized membrane protein (DUF485 family)
MKSDEKHNIHNQKKYQALHWSRLVFCLVMIFIAFFLVWPGYTVFSDATPLIFGFPTSFAWIIFCTIAGFIAMLTLYISDINREDRD